MTGSNHKAENDNQEQMRLVTSASQIDLNDDDLDMEELTIENDEDIIIPQIPISKSNKPRVNFDLDESYVEYNNNNNSDFKKMNNGTGQKQRSPKGNNSRHYDYYHPESPPNNNNNTSRRRSRISSKKNTRLTTKVIVMLILPALVLFVLFFVVSTSSSNPPKSASPEAAPTGMSYPSGFNMKQNWGSASPYFDTGAPFIGIDSSKSFDRSAKCYLRQSHVLHRHGERYPTSGMTKKLSATAEKLMNMGELPSSSRDFDWITRWNFTLGADLLTSVGVGTEFKAGSDYWGSHGNLVYNATRNGNNQLFYSPKLNVFENGTQRPNPVLRATTQSRIETSARAWAAGFFGVYGGQTYDVVENEHHNEEEAKEGLNWNSNALPDSSSDYITDAGIYSLILQAEVAGNNNTLASYYACPGDSEEGTTGEAKRRNWINTYLESAAVRLNKVFPGFGNMTALQAYDLQNLCVFETAAYGQSRFCELFTESEWRGFEYAGDLNFYYDSSFGTPLGSAMGVGYLTELLARLKHQYVIEEVNKGVNLTLDSNPDTFPLGQPFYLDMSHDSIIISVLTALGFDFLNIDLPDTKILAPRQFIASRLVPFGARLMFDIFQCDAENENVGQTFVRVSLNNRVLPLGSLKDCPQSEDGLCPFSKFVSSLQHQIDSIDFVATCYKGGSGRLQERLFEY